jgi:hypothetical protein
MKLKLLSGYRSKQHTNGHYYAAGDYDLADDDRLARIAQYLVDNGHALLLAEPEQSQTVVSFSFTNGALVEFELAGIDPETTVAYFKADGVNRVTKRHAMDYIEAQG